jgi:hypothetical protein
LIKFEFNFGLNQTSLERPDGTIESVQSSNTDNIGNKREDEEQTQLHCSLDEEQTQLHCSLDEEQTQLQCSLEEQTQLHCSLDEEQTITLLT